MKDQAVIFTFKSVLIGYRDQAFKLKTLDTKVPNSV